jgi:hypothetical protein
MLMKISIDIIGNRSRDRPVCSAVPQPQRHRVPPYSESPFEMLARKPAMFTNGFCGLSKYLQVNAVVVFEVRSGTLSSNPSPSN